MADWLRIWVICVLKGGYWARLDRYTTLHFCNKEPSPYLYVQCYLACFDAMGPIGGLCKEAFFKKTGPFGNFFDRGPTGKG